jgi:hypothetical protein
MKKYFMFDFSRSFVLSIVYLATLSVTQNAYRQMFRQLVNDELERVWKEAILTYSKVLSQYSHGETEVNHEQPHESQYPGLGSDRAPPEYILEALILQPKYSAQITSV